MLKAAVREAAREARKKAIQAAAAAGKEKATSDKAAKVAAKDAGKDKVAKKEPITIDNKSVSVIELSEGPDRNGKQIGVIYLFDAGPDAKDRWKVKLRAIVNKTSQTEGLKSVNDLLRQFQW